MHGTHSVLFHTHSFDFNHYTLTSHPHHGQIRNTSGCSDFGLTGLVSAEDG